MLLDVHTIKGNPPTAAFFAGTHLEYLTSPMSEMELVLGTPPADSSLNSSVTSSVFREEFSRNSSVDSMSSIEPSRSINPSDYRMRNVSSASSVDTVNRSNSRQRNPPSNSSEEFAEVDGRSSSFSGKQDQYFVPGGFAFQP